MRILVLCHEFPPVGGGASAVCGALSAEYARLGHDVTVITMGWSDLPASEQVEGVNVIRMACGRRRIEMASVLEALRWAKLAKQKVKELHAQQPFDITHAHFIMPAGIAALSLFRSQGVPYIITSHGTDVPGYNRERMKLAHVLARPWWRKIVGQAAMIVSTSHSLLGLIEKTIRLPHSTVIPNGYQPGRFTTGHKERRILLCSRLVERKGFQYFLQAIQDWELPGWEIDLVGDGPMYATLAELAEQCRTPVHMHGWLNNDDPRLTELYNRAMIFVMPSEWENFPVSLLEGMSAGCAVITTNVSGNPEVVGETGYLVPPRDGAALRAALEELTSDETRCRELGNSAKARVQDEFLWEKIAQRYLEVMTPLVSQEATVRQ